MTQAEADRAAAIIILRRKLTRFRLELAALTLAVSSGHVLTRKA
jgi:hypothetical protein